MRTANRPTTAGSPRRLLPAALLACAPIIAVCADQADIELHHAQVAEADFGDARLRARADGLRAGTPEFALWQGRTTVALDYAYTHYDYIGLPTRDRDLHRLALPLQWTGDGDRHRLRLTVAPTVATSSNVFKDLPSRGTGDDVSLYGAMTVERPATAGWGWRAGAGYDDRFGDPQAFPIAQLLYAGRDIELALGWPRSEATWRPQRPWRLRAEVAPTGQRWHVVSDERDGADFFQVSQAWLAALGLEWEPHAHWRLRLSAGYAFDRRHDLVDDTGARIDQDVDDAMTWALRLGYVF